MSSIEGVLNALSPTMSGLVPTVVVVVTWLLNRRDREDAEAKASRALVAQTTVLVKKIDATVPPVPPDGVVA